MKAVKTTVAVKEVLIAQGLAYVEKCDGSYFFYLNEDNNANTAVRITKKTYDRLNYAQCMRRNKIEIEGGVK